jgi:hypothetical protein
VKVSRLEQMPALLPPMYVVDPMFVEVRDYDIDGVAEDRGELHHRTKGYVVDLVRPLIILQVLLEALDHLVAAESRLIKTWGLWTTKRS